jgi:hypothetical protein
LPADCRAVIDRQISRLLEGESGPRLSSGFYDLLAEVIGHNFARSTLVNRVQALRGAAP